MGDNGHGVVRNALGPGHSSTGGIHQTLDPNHGNGYTPALQSHRVDHTGRRARPSVSYPNECGISFLLGDLIKKFFGSDVTHIGFLEKSNDLEGVFLF